MTGAGGTRPVRERDRYRRASLREQAGGVLAELRDHPGVIAILVVVFGGWAFLRVSQPAVAGVDALATGDCLYVHATDADTDSTNGRATGTTSGQVASLYASGAERAGCDASHSHEVVLQVVFPDAAGAAYPGLATLTGRTAGTCRSAFEPYVGHPVDGSAFALIVAVPPEAAWAAGVRGAPCLLATNDGSFLLSHAKGSGR
jgi:hypothetical protein